MKVAFTSKDGICIDEHFGWSKEFYIYELDASGYRLVETINASTELEVEGEKLDYKIALIKECAILFTLQIGPSASTKVANAHIHIIRASSPETTIDSQLQELYGLQTSTPPIWLVRALHKS
jgi:nitrogen fixation protein NifX